MLAAAGSHYATYYTSVPAARLLADLVVRTPHPSWRTGSSLAVIDPACGTGTLLASACAAIGDAHGAGEAHGWEVLAFAAQLARVTLALQGSAATIRVMPVGVKDGRIRLGSLDHLRPGAPRRRYPVVLMNPPFSRSAKPNLSFGYSAPDLRRRMQAELSQLAARLGLSGIGRAGSGPYFMMLGLTLLGDEGRIGLVVPRSMLSGVSWKKIPRASRGMRDHVHRLEFRSGSAGRRDRAVELERAHRDRRSADRRGTNGEAAARADDDAHQRLPQAPQR